MKLRPVPKITNTGIVKDIFASQMRAMLDNPSPFEQGLTFTEAICKKLLHRAADPENDNYYAIELVMNRVDGRPSQNISIEQAVTVLLELDDMQLSKALGLPLRELQNKRRQLGLVGDLEAEAVSVEAKES